MQAPRKRQRTSGVVPRINRPIDKQLIAIAQTSTTSMVSTTLSTVTFPCTVLGLRWSLNFTSASSAANPLVGWVIVVIPDGESINTIGLSDGADFYTPEQNVLAFGTAKVADNDGGVGPLVHNTMGNTKTMRKLKQGDVLAFGTICGTANGVLTTGCVQFFCKS